MQAVIKVFLKCPRELRMLHVARMYRGVVSVNAFARIADTDYKLHLALVKAPRAELNQWMLVLLQFRFHFLYRAHPRILK